MVESRYIIGIDLGTTNCALTYIDTHAPEINIQTLPLSQSVSINETYTNKTLPSFIYFPPSTQQIDQKDNYRIGIFARETAQIQPERVISSTKSWLCHEKVNRRSNILPWHGAEDIELLTPIEATSLLIRQMMDSWNQMIPDAKMQDQQIIITVPASFNETARTLTKDAIEQVGLHAFLLEEPQAAFYAWLYHNAETWKQQLNQHTCVLVCDVGGGTTDFSLIGVENKSNEMQLKRIAVGDHLLLGGDNLDIALAHYLEPRFTNNRKLNPKDWGRLINQCRNAKEIFLQKDAPEQHTIMLTASGKSLISATIQKDITKEEIVNLLIQGFLPDCTLTDSLSTQQSGFQEFGLPYANDPAITKHLATFLQENLQQGLKPTAVLFNGGFFEAHTFKTRILNILRQWFQSDIQELNTHGLDMAVAQGAAYYGLAQRGHIQKIESGLPRATYIGIADKNNQMQALCLAPIGMQEGDVVELKDILFKLRVNRPVEFPIYSTKGFAHIKPGEIVEPSQLTLGVPIRTFLKTGKKSKGREITVHLECTFSVLGTLEIFCKEKDGDRNWKLEFDTKNFNYQQYVTEKTATVNETKEHSDEFFSQIQEEIASVFQNKSIPPERLTKKIESITKKNRWEWDLYFLRNLWEELIKYKEGRKLSEAHEERWLNLTGFCLRPGYGVEMDDWRVGQTWSIFMEGITFTKNAQSNSEWFIFWNRIAGGLDRFQQKELASQYIAAIKVQNNLQNHNSQNTNQGRAKKIQLGQGEKTQFYRMLGNLEELSLKDKREIITYVLGQIKKYGIEDANYNGIWALSRIAARAPLYGALNNVLSTQKTLDILKQLMEYKGYRETDLNILTNMVKKTGDRYRDIEEEELPKIIAWFNAQDPANQYDDIITKIQPQTEKNRNLIFGESLPPGLFLL